MTVERLPADERLVRYRDQVAPPEALPSLRVGVMNHVGIDADVDGLLDVVKLSSLAVTDTDRQRVDDARRAMGGL